MTLSPTEARERYVAAHPHPDPAHVMRCYRRYILSRKKSWGTARGLVHYRGMVETYLAAKRVVVP